MHSELHGNLVHHDVELLLLVSMLFLLAIPTWLMVVGHSQCNIPIRHKAGCLQCFTLWSLLEVHLCFSMSLRLILPTL